MQIINYFESDIKNQIIEKIEACDWGAAKFLTELLREDRFFEMLGGEGDLFVMLDGDNIVSFLTLTRQDVVRDESMYPWIGFVYTVPEYRGHRYSEKLMKYAEGVATAKGFDKVYVATDHVGLYEKFGYEYLENRIGYWGDDNRVLFKTLTDKEDKTMNIKTDRLLITEFTMDMAVAVHLNSLDEDNRRFNPDEVFETVDEAKETVKFLMSVYESGDGPLVYPVLLHDNTYIGYVQAVPFEDGKWEIGYHIGGAFTKKGYATEAVKAFLPVIMKKLNITEMAGVCIAENIGSVKVLEKSGFVKEFEGIGSYQGVDREICRFYFYMSPKDLVVKFFEDGYTNQNYDFIMKCVADDYIDHSPAGARSNADAVEILKIVANQFSDLKVKVLDVFAEDEMVATRVLYDAVHTGECMGIAPTSKRINFEALENFRIENGKIVESWGYWPDKEIEAKLH